MSSPRPGARLRARRALLGCGLPVTSPLTPAVSYANEVWVGSDFVLRVNFRGDLGRLAREARVLRALPEAARVPALLACGGEDRLEWSLSERVPGRTLASAWPGLSRPQRRAAAQDLAQALRAIHGCQADGLPADEDLAGPHVLPAGRSLAQLAQVRAEGPTRSALRTRAHAWLSRSQDLLTSSAALVHGDLHLENVLWHPEAGLHVLDLEWSRRSLPEVDLEILLSFFRSPACFLSGQAGLTATPAEYAECEGWLRADYPDLFLHPRLGTRLALLKLIRQVGFLADGEHEARAWSAIARILERVDGPGIDDAQTWLPGPPPTGGCLGL